MKDQKARLRKLLETEFLVLPGSHDCLSAMIIESVGFEAVYVSGAGVSVCRLGRPDVGFVNLSEMMDVLNKVTSSVSIPVLADADNGFGNAMHVADTARAYEKLGVCGMQVDDQVLPASSPTTSKEMMPWELVEPKLRTLRSAVSDEFVVVFRTIARMTADMPEAIRRANRAHELGADYVFVDGLASLEDVREVSRHVRSPLIISMNEKGFPATLPVQDLGDMGYRIGLFPVSSMSIAAKSMFDLFTTLRETRSTLSLRNQMMNPVDIYNLVGLERLTQEALRSETE